MQTQNLSMQVHKIFSEIEKEEILDRIRIEALCNWYKQKLDEYMNKNEVAKLKKNKHKIIQHMDTHADKLLIYSNCHV